MLLAGPNNLNTEVSSGFPVHPAPVRRSFSIAAYALIGFAAIVAVVPFYDALSRLYDIWNLQPEYSHGILIPPISAFLIWRERAWISTARFDGSWSGLVLTLGGLAFWFLGEFATIYTIEQYGFLLVLYGLVVALAGWHVFRRLWMPLLILIFMVPLPAFFSNTLSLKLQLLSSTVGVALIRLAGISVLLEGNVIDLGTYKLEVAEACSGLRYLFPLMTLAFILAYLFRGAMWKRVLLFASSVPIAIVMNSFRIGVIGITVDHWGTRMAEGVLHDFEGWVVFMLSTAVLMLVAFALARVGHAKATLRESLTLDLGPSLPRALTAPRSIPPAFLGATALGVVACVLSVTLPQRVEISPARAEFATFPNQLGDWRGRQQSLEKIYLDTLKLDDYVLADYKRSARLPPVNFYVAYYGSQRKGQAVHSPRSCLPGGGWDVRSFEQRSLANVQVNGNALQINRAVIEMGTQHQVVYYWFQQRGRVITSEYLVKWYIFLDALTRNRSDGALVRLVAAVPKGAEDSVADAELAAFAEAVASKLGNYVPG